MKDTSLDKQLQKDLKDLIAELVEIAPSSDRDRVWRYLEKIYEARRALEKHSGPSLGRVLNTIAKTLHRRFDKNVARLLIEMSVPSSTSTKMKRKYSDSVNLA